MDTDKTTVAICNYNTTDLTNQCISSFLKYHDFKKYNIVVLDNSDMNAFVPTNNVKVINNTKQTIVNFDLIFKLSPYKLMCTNQNNFGSLRHAISILFLLDACQTQKMILFDSDIIVNKALDFIDDDNFITVADLLQNGTYAYEDEKRLNILYTSKTRFLPYILLFNLDLMRKNCITYFDFARIHGIVAPNNGNHYDTGASFYEDCVSKNVAFKRINYRTYITHLGLGSWKKAFNETYK